MNNITPPTKEQILSKTIIFLRFPLIIGVVLIHSQFKDIIINGKNMTPDMQFPIYYTIMKLFSIVLSSISVPLFFTISGFLFFYKTDFFQKENYFHKLKKRMKTILTPYLIWNLFTILFFFLAQIFIPTLMSGRNKPIIDYTIYDFCLAFWDRHMIDHNMEKGFPICYQFWFLRDLMIVMISSPLIYFLLKKLKLILVIILITIWALNYKTGISGISIVSFAFFTMGAYFSIFKKINFVKLYKFFYPIIILYPIMAIFETLSNSNIIYLHNINILLGIIFTITLTSRLIEKEYIKPNHFLSGSSFFIFAYHAIVLSFMIKVSFLYLKPQNDYTLVFLYIAIPTIVVLIGIYLYKVLNKYLPKFTSFITGGR